MHSIQELFSISDVIFLKKGDVANMKALVIVLKYATAKTRINKPVSLHWNHNSYSTYFQESGIDLRNIQELLWRNSSKTTEIYTHASTKSLQQIKNPFDEL